MKRSLDAAVLVAMSFPALGLSAEFETPPVLSARDTVQDLPLETDVYRIKKRVPTDGFMAIYSIT